MITKSSQTTNDDAKNDNQQTQSRTKKAASWLMQMALAYVLSVYVFVPAIDYIVDHVFDELLAEDDA